MSPAGGDDRAAGSVTVALIQMTAGIEPEANTALVCRLMGEAAARGAQWIATPEMTVCLDSDPKRLLAQTHDEDEDPHLTRLCRHAAALGVVLLIGSMAVRAGTGADGRPRLANRSFLIGPDGTIRARYDKVHLFDVSLGDGERYAESRLYQPGDRAVVADAGFATLGLSVCYDLRFPALYRGLAEAGARILTVPAAFTVPTGRAHWHVLLRARAIETGCFVIAPAQAGRHADGRATYGHSLVVDPWGTVLLDAGPAEPETTPGVHLVALDLAAVDQARGRIPALTHARAVRVEGVAGQAAPGTPAAGGPAAADETPDEKPLRRHEGRER
ncbi:carbon-nitrogen hydrolase family protein [Rhodothalassium salexigens]|uniref:carbon-nitrogen hydrolase family protein n=1 Tax=Rhodothalassium salexigens TaxID=1086 RepID=UPI0019133F27|nr:carbon-nitrogen hydrolase family protein [Rhodothalassium salexigens]